MAEHKWDMCMMCGPMVRCGYCGNNCCNGGSGDDCPDKCASAYALQTREGDAHYEAFKASGEYDKWLEELEAWRKKYCATPEEIDELIKSWETEK